jgi:hypothetical protein
MTDSALTSVSVEVFLIRSGGSRGSLEMQEIFRDLGDVDGSRVDWSLLGQFRSALM